MFKKLALLSVMLSLGACETVIENKNCDYEKKYEISNIEEMKKYEAMLKQQKTSVFFEKTTPSYCNDDACAFFDSNKFNFIEKNFDDKLRKGVYTITESNNIQDPNCVKQSSLMIGEPRKCFIFNKNIDNKSKADYKFLMESKDDSMHLKFENQITKTYLYEIEYQMYSTGAIGAHGLSYCKTPFKNDSNYKFNIDGFQTGNFNIRAIVQK